QDASKVFLVLDHENALGHSATFLHSARVGNSIRKTEPLPRVDSTQMRPPCISTICLEIARPKPVPPLALVLELSTWWNCSNTRVSWSGGMPGPVSATLTANVPLAATADTRTSPLSVNLMALPTRLSSTCVRRCSSPRPKGSFFATSVLKVSFLFC